MNTVTQCYVCECNGRDYKSRAGLRSHQQTQKHILWTSGAELRALKVDLTRRDNRIVELEADLIALKDFNHRLVREIYTLRNLPRNASSASMLESQ